MCLAGTEVLIIHFQALFFKLSEHFVHILIMLLYFLNFFYRIHDRTVIFSAKNLAQFRVRRMQQLPAQKHGYLPGQHHFLLAFAAEDIRW